MKKQYQHLTLGEREQLSVLRDQGLTFKDISGVLHRDQSCLSREYRKNSKYYRHYQPHLAQQKADKIAVIQRTKAPLKCKEIYLYVRQHLRMGWSSEKLLLAGYRLTFPGIVSTTILFTNMFTILKDTG